MSLPRFKLVTGATGCVGAHVVDELLRRGHRVRATTRSIAKGEEMRRTRPTAADRLEFVLVGNFAAGCFDEAARGVDGIFHCAAPVATTFENPEQDAIIPAIEGVKAVLSAATQEPDRTPIWVDVRDLAYAHVEALFKPEAGGRRFLVSAPEKFSHQLVADITRREFDWARDIVRMGEEGKPLPPSFKYDGETAGRFFGIEYRSFRECIIDAMRQFREISQRESGE
ncbi:hypothetical protein EIP91_006001 [Steccherinum ochraceum]|uniref:NAD-dependent epimerase/dehydratase domain-containing protein n=1 Tax=Steccherinum ochraceum TaxID=92696 RepID=A0A4V2MVR7_9APHY|nr:hypothetical protein EIP91_006001 [Steccherinum ochraceum]